jgi:hypothetical protein
LFSAAAALGLAMTGEVRSWGQEKAAPRAAPAPAMRVAPRAPADDDAFVRQVEQQYAAQFRHMLKSELHFMRVVTEPTKPQYDKIAVDGEAGMKPVARAFAQSMRGVAQFKGDPRTPLIETIGKSVKANLSPDQAASYQKELDLRIAARKRLFVTNVVAMIDRAVILQPGQRDKLGEILAANWDDSWQIQVLMYGGQYYPALPEAKIRPVLSEAQQKVWQGITKSTVRFGPNLGFVPGIEIEDEVWDADPPAPKAAEKPGPRR